MQIGRNVKQANSKISEHLERDWRVTFLYGEYCLAVSNGVERKSYVFHSKNRRVPLTFFFSKDNNLGRSSNEKRYVVSTRNLFLTWSNTTGRCERIVVQCNDESRRMEDIAGDGDFVPRSSTRLFTIPTVSAGSISSAVHYFNVDVGEKCRIDSGVSCDMRFMSLNVNSIVNYDQFAAIHLMDELQNRSEIILRRSARCAVASSDVKDLRQ